MKLKEIKPGMVIHCKDESEPDRGNMNMEIFPDCSIMCYLAEK